MIDEEERELLLDSARNQFENARRYGTSDPATASALKSIAASLIVIAESMG